MVGGACPHHRNMQWAEELFVPRLVNVEAVPASAASSGADGMSATKQSSNAQVCEQTNHCMLLYGVDMAFPYHWPYHCLGFPNGPSMTSVSGLVQWLRH